MTDMVGNTVEPRGVQKGTSEARPLLEDAIIDTILKTNDNILISGPGGTGKSFLISTLMKKRTLASGQIKRIAVTAATGVAAINVGGTTAHRFFGCGIAKGSIDSIIGTVNKNKDAKIRITSTDTLVIDEMSMISGELFEIFDQICRYFRQCDKLPFGGMQIVAVADFLQLCPVTGGWAFESETWTKMRFRPFILTEPKRFTDLAFFNTLMRIREGRLTKGDDQKIKDRVEAYNKYIQNLEIKSIDQTTSTTKIRPTVLYSLKNDANSMNTRELQKLPSLKTFKSIDTYQPPTGFAGSISRSEISRKEFYQASLDELAPQELTLGVGAQVMITWNLSVDSGICNGTRGIVEALSTDTITIGLRNGAMIDIERFPFKIEQDRTTIIRRQFPVIVAYAITTHKSQGSTLDFVIVDLGPSVFAKGQAYVALSRARNWESLLVSNYSRKSIKADPDALRYMKSLTELEPVISGVDEHCSEAFSKLALPLPVDDPKDQADH